MLGPFRYPAFRAIWTANLASNIGSAIQSAAAAWLMTDLTSSHQLVALVQASTTIPVMALGLFAGVIADNYDRRKVMIAAQAGMLIASGLLAALTYADAIGSLLLLCITLAVGAGTALNGPAWQASVRLQVGPDDLPQAISLNTVAFNLARSVGPALGGLLIMLWTPALAFALNAVSYFAMIWVLMRWRPQIRIIPRREPMLPAIRAGVSYCLHSSPLRRVLMRGFAFGFGGAGFHALAPLLVKSQIGGTEVDFGMVLGGFGMGSIVAAFWVSRARRRWGSEAVVTVATLVLALSLLPLAVTTSLGVAMIAAFAGGMGWVSTLTSLNVAMQLRSPEEILGRCLSLYQAVTFGGMALGAYAIGLAADLFGMALAFRAAAAWLVTTLVLLRLFAPMPAPGEGRRLPSH